MISVIEERRFVARRAGGCRSDSGFALLPWLSAAPCSSRNGAAPGRRHRSKNITVCSCRISPEYRMRKLTCGARPARCARPDGAEAVVALGVGRGASPAGERRVVEAAGRIRLPDLEDHVVERLAVELGHPAGDLDDVTRCTLRQDRSRPARTRAGKNGPRVISAVGMSRLMAERRCLCARAPRAGARRSSRWSWKARGARCSARARPGRGSR